MLTRQKIGEARPGLAHFMMEGWQDGDQYWSAVSVPFLSQGYLICSGLRSEDDDVPRLHRVPKRSHRQPEHQAALRHRKRHLPLHDPERAERSERRDGLSGEARIQLMRRTVASLNFTCPRINYYKTFCMLHCLHSVTHRFNVRIPLVKEI